MGEAGRIVGLLADPVRRRVFAAVVLGARSHAEVAERAGIDPTRAQRAIGRLLEGGVLDDEQGALDVVGDVFRSAAREAGIRARAVGPVAPDGPLRGYMRDGRLTQIPTKRAAQGALIDLLAASFEEGVDYSEKEVNARVSAVHDDYATLRRMLVDAGRLARSHGVYRRVSAN